VHATLRGHFKNIHGLTFDLASPESCAVEVEIDARTVWTGEPDRDGFFVGDLVEITIDAEAILEGA
jgi:polyisoprenoid-binding protein YceI